MRIASSSASTFASRTQYDNKCVGNDRVDADPDVCAGVREGHHGRRVGHHGLDLTGIGVPDHPGAELLEIRIEAPIDHEVDRIDTEFDRSADHRPIRRGGVIEEAELVEVHAAASAAPGRRHD